MSKKIIEIESLQSGQPRPYADSFYEANISIFNVGTLTDGSGFYQSLSKELVLKIAKILVHNFEEVPENWASPKLVRCEPIGPTKEMIEKCTHPKWQPGPNTRWNVVIKEEYTD
jgi:hypothetical protein